MQRLPLRSGFLPSMTALFPGSLPLQCFGSWPFCSPFSASSGISRGNTQNGCTAHKRIITCRKSKNTTYKITDRGWSSFKKPSEKSVKCSECESKGATRSVKRTKAKTGYCKLTTPRGREGDGERWRVHGKGLSEGSRGRNEN